MNFLKNNMLHIFEVAREERTDGDNFVGDLSLAHNLFLNGLTIEGKQYHCMEPLDKSTLLAYWESLNGDEWQAEYDEYHAIIKEHYDALCAAFSCGDMVTFHDILQTLGED